MIGSDPKNYTCVYLIPSKQLNLWQTNLVGMSLCPLPGVMLCKMLSLLLFKSVNVIGWVQNVTKCLWGWSLNLWWVHFVSNSKCIISRQTADKVCICWQCKWAHSRVYLAIKGLLGFKSTIQTKCTTILQLLKRIFGRYFAEVQCGNKIWNWVKNIMDNDSNNKMKKTRTVSLF